jgi:hypothetical protein
MSVRSGILSPCTVEIAIPTLLTPLRLTQMHATDHGIAGANPMTQLSIANISDNNLMAIVSSVAAHIR